MQVAGDPEGPGLLGEGAADGLADPPGGVRGELEALAPIELVDGTDQAEVALLDQVDEVDAGLAAIALRLGHHEPEVGIEKAFPRFFAPPYCMLNAAALGGTELVAALKSGDGVVARLDELRQFDLFVCRQEWVDPDRREVLGNGVDCGCSR